VHHGMTARVIIQIPCYQEVGQLPRTLADLPRELPGCTVEWLVIDDGSTDGTADVARANGVHHVLRLGQHRGLAVAFARGLEEAVRLGADYIVNTDADNQYCAADVPALLAPLQRDEAEICVGARPIAEIDHFSFAKKYLQRIGSAVVRKLSGVAIPDATSGFRAFSRDAALRVNVFSNYTYTLETLIQAGQRGMRVVSVPVRVNPPARPSRLARSSTSYVLRSTVSIVHAFIVYRPFRFLAILAALSILAGVALGVRFLAIYITAGSAGHIQSLIAAAILTLAGGLLLVAAIVADLLAINRRILEDVQAMLRRREWRPP
jgi:glycosyltransferase involved in cell wall biosynthesis